MFDIFTDYSETAWWDEMIRAFVPEADYLGFADAMEQAEVRNELEADALMQSLVDGGVV